MTPAAKCGTRSAVFEPPPSPAKAREIAKRIAKRSRLSEQELFDALTEHLDASRVAADERPTLIDAVVDWDSS